MNSVLNLGLLWFRLRVEASKGLFNRIFLAVGGVGFVPARAKGRLFRATHM